MINILLLTVELILYQFILYKIQRFFSIFIKWYI